MPELFGTLVQMHRNLQRLTMRELARRVGVDVGYISKLEKGQLNNPSFGITMRLAKELDIKMESLVRAFELDEGLDSFIDVSMEKSVSRSERDMLKQIVSDVFQFTDNPKLDGKVLGTLLEEIIGLRIAKHKENYYVVTVVDKDWLRVLKTPVIDETLLSLYHEIYETKRCDSFVVKGELILHVDVTRTEMVTLMDLWEKCHSVSDEEDVFDAHRDMIEYLEEIDSFDLDVK